MQCSHCGAALRPTNKICIACGADVGAPPIDVDLILNAAEAATLPPSAHAASPVPSVPVMATAEVAAPPEVRGAVPRPTEPAPEVQQDAVPVPLMMPVSPPIRIVTPSQVTPAKKMPRGAVWGIAVAAVLLFAGLGIYAYQDSQVKAVKAEMARKSLIEEAEKNAAEKEAQLQAMAENLKRQQQELEERRKAQEDAAAKVAASAAEAAAVPTATPRSETAPPARRQVGTTTVKKANEQQQVNRPKPMQSPPIPEVISPAPLPPAPADNGNPEKNCAARTNLISREICQSRECKKPEFINTPMCQRFRNDKPVPTPGAQGYCSVCHINRQVQPVAQVGTLLDSLSSLHV